MRSLLALLPLLLLSSTARASNHSYLAETQDVFARQLALDTQAVRDAGYATEAGFLDYEGLEKRAVSVYGDQLVALPPVFKYGSTKVRGVSELGAVAAGCEGADEV